MYLFSDRTTELLYEGQVNVSITHSSEKYSVEVSLFIPQQVFPSVLLKQTGTLSVLLHQSSATMHINLSHSDICVYQLERLCHVVVCCNPIFDCEYEWD